MDMLLYEVATPEVGKVYEVLHSRRGTFRVRVTHVLRGRTSGIITEGEAGARNPGNVRRVGNEITIFNAHCTFYEEQ